MLKDYVYMLYPPRSAVNTLYVTDRMRKQLNDHVAMCFIDGVLTGLTSI